MNAVLTATPPGTQAAILQAVLAEKHPKLAFGAIASRFGLTMVDLQAVLRRYGYPDIDKMTRASQELVIEAQERTALEADDDAGDVATVLASVPVDRLLSDPENLRDHLEDIEDLADSILSVGLLQPIVVRRATGDRLIVVAGHRRLAAVRHLKWTDVPVIIRGPMRPDHVLMAMLIENGQRTDLDPIEEARGLSKLKKEKGCPDYELARMIGRSVAFISSRMALLDLTAEEQALVRAGELGITHAARRGRLNSGKMMSPGQTRDWHLSDTHDLAAQVKARCIRLGHKNGRKVGGTGCGECWETVIRTDERRVLLVASHDGVCPTCGSQA